MAWIEITPEIVAARLSAPELVAFSQKALQQDQADPVAEIIAQVVASARQALAANPLNVLAEGATVPESALRHVLAIIRPLVANRLPNMKRLIDDLRMKEWENAEAWLRSKPKVEKPETAAPETEQINAAPSPSVTERPKQFSRRDQDGL